MNKNSRYLPRLNLCYLQKKAFENHKLKMQRIRSSLCSTHNAQHISTNRHLSQQRQPRLILEQSYLNTADRSTPYQRRTLKLTQIQNSRLFKAIKQCPSTISHKELMRHSQRSLLEKERIMKFKTEASCVKTILKSKLSLEKISAYEQRKWSTTGSRIMVRSPTNSKQSKLNFLKVKLDRQQQQGKQKKASFFVKSPKYKQQHFKGAINRNLLKLMEKEVEENPLIAEEKLKGFRQKPDFTRSRMHISQIHKWKTRCFTSQQQSHQ